ncbi:hypothetical protein C8J57DRAFT_1713655 [Mycena rebaudengoi]|nr:hypothetical protein C8J57DRAFT_1713655 [Mycena rebaudengoi]
MISFLLAPIFWLILARLGVDAQVVSPTWRKPNITTSTADRIRVVSAALEQALNHIGSDGQFTDSEEGGWGRAGPFYRQMADFDIATGQNKYGDTLQKNLALVQMTGVNFSDETDYGRAAAKAYSAYGTQIFLDYAIQAWWSGREYTLTPDNVNSGKTNVKNYPITKTCDGVTMAGGTFWSNDTSEPDVSALSTGIFLVLSALLAEATSDPMYLQAASDAADFIDAHLYTSSHLVQDAISARQNDSCKVETYTDPAYSGIFIEGLSILFSITKKASIQLLLNDLITVIPHTTWQQEDGILVNGDDFIPGELVRGLEIAYVRNVTSPQLRDWIKAYIAVQFNAVIDLATNGTNVYAYKWEGPPSSTFDGGAQTDAINVLLSAISLKADSLPSSSTNGSPSSTAAIPPPSSISVSRRSSMTGPIVGGVIGGMALLSCFVFVFWMVRRRQLRRTDGSGAPSTTVAPFVFTPYAERPSVGLLSILAPQRAKPSNDSFTTSPTSGSVGDQLDGAALGGITPMVFAPCAERPFSEPLTVLAPQRANPNNVNFRPLPTSGSVGDQLDGAALGGQAEYAWNTQQWRRTSEAQSVIPTAQLIVLLHERLLIEGNQDPPPDYPPSRQ